METMYELNADYNSVVDAIKNNRGQYIKIDKNSYYHGLSSDLLPTIIQDGILSHKKRGSRNEFGFNNGNHYISVAQNVEGSYIYKNLIKQGCSIVIDKNIKAIKTKYSSGGNIVWAINMTRLPIRFSPYIDEHHVRDEIKKEDFIAIQCYLLDILSKSNKENGIRHIFEAMKIIEIMEELSITIPFIDGTDSTEINNEVLKKHVLRR